MKQLFFGTLLFAIVHFVLLNSLVLAEDRPNILWITAEDMSATLGCYGDGYATTPRIDGLAAQSVRYTNAFATAPVCSPSRSTLITGCYATSLGTCQMRSAFPIPDSMRGFPALLRDQSYFTTNNVKTDYNTSSSDRIIASSWNQSSEQAHWRDRPDKSKPLFSVFNLMTSHQSRTMQWPQMQFRDEVQSRLDRVAIHDPAKAPLPPYYPDTMVVRRTVARFYDSVSVMDAQVGKILDQLEADGLEDDTIVFFFSDHGSGMPRHKRVLLDSGMHVPLLIRFPQKFAHLAPADPGESTDRLVSFVDFAPTVLALCGVDPTDDMQGHPFLGIEESDDKLSQPRLYVYGHRDRIDEAIDLSRSVRDKRYLYVRHYMPHLGWNERSRWPDVGEVNHEFYRLSHDDQTLPDAVRQFISPTRTQEELYDCQNDPHNLVNLVDSPDHAEILLRLRRENTRHLRATRDLGFVPESFLWDCVDGSNPWDYGQANSVAVADAVNAATSIAGLSEPDLRQRLKNGDSVDRFWAAIGLIGFKEDASRRQLLHAAEHDSVSSVRIAAADAIGRFGRLDDVAGQLIRMLEHDDLSVALHAARTIELFGHDAPFAVEGMQKLARRAAKFEPSTTGVTFELSKNADLAMFCSFSANGFLEKMKEGKWIDLFDGESLAKWRPLEDGRVGVRDGEIHMLSKGKNLWLMHDGEFDDFELVAEAKMPTDKYNSGIAFRCREKPNGRPSGYQCEIAAEKSGMLYGIGKGWIWPKTDQESKAFLERAGDAFSPDAWNHFRIRCEADKIQIWVNGIQTTDLSDDSFQAGSIAIQHHGRGGVHRFRNMRIRSINSLQNQKAPE